MEDTSIRQPTLSGTVPDNADIAALPDAVRRRQPSAAHARRHLDDRGLRLQPGASPRGRARDQRDRRPCSSAAATTSTRRAPSSARSSRTTRCCSTTWPRPSSGSAPRSPVRHAHLRPRRLRRRRHLRHCPRRPDAPGLGADVDWHLPSRFEEGYGVPGATISHLADEGCALLLTVDCGITAVAEVAAARRGLGVIVTDHHRPGDTCRVPGGGDAAVQLPVPGGSAAPASSASWRRHSAPRNRRISTSSRSRRSPTSSRCWTRTARSRSPVYARSRGHGGLACRR